MNNPFTSALDSIGDNFAGLGAGTNSLIAPQAVNLFGFNIPGVPIVSARDYFLVQMESWFTAIPKNSQWLIVIDRYPPAIRSSVIQGLERHDGSKKGYDISTAVNILKSFPLQKVAGCLFAHSISLPPETYDVQSASVPNNRGFLPGIIAGGRDITPPVLQIEFRETNTSFIDFVLRPWTILASHFGYAARPGDKGARKDNLNMKCNMTLLNYTFTYHSISMIPRKAFTFYNCVPTQVSEETYNYEADSLTTYSTRWTYSNYSIENSLYLPIADIVNRISNGAIPRVTSFQNGMGSINPLGFL